MKKEDIERSVNQLAARIEQFGARLERDKATQAQVEKAFQFLAAKMLAVQNRALIAAQGPGQTFSLDMELSTAPMPPIAHPGPLKPALHFPPGARAAAPIRSGLSVADIGGRFVREARPETHSSAGPSAMLDDGVGFIDDEDGPDELSSSSTAIDGVDFVDD